MLGTQQTLYNFDFKHFNGVDTNPKVTCMTEIKEGRDNVEWQLSQSQNLFRLMPDRWAMAAGNEHRILKAMQELLQGGQDTARDSEGNRVLVTGHMGDGLTTGINVLIQEGFLPILSTGKVPSGGTDVVWMEINFDTNTITMNNVSEEVFQAKHILSGESGKRTTRKNTTAPSASFNIISSIKTIVNDATDELNVDVDDLTAMLNDVEEHPTLWQTSVTIPFTDVKYAAFAHYNNIAKLMNVNNSWTDAMVADAWHIRACTVADMPSDDNTITKVYIYCNGLYVTQQIIAASPDAHGFSAIAFDIHTNIPIMDSVDRILNFTHMTHTYSLNKSMDGAFAAFIMGQKFLGFASKFEGHIASMVTFMCRHYKETMAKNKLLDAFVYDVNSEHVDIIAKMEFANLKHIATCARLAEIAFDKSTFINIDGCLLYTSPSPRD